MNCRLPISISIIIAVILLGFSYSFSTDWIYIGSNDSTNIFDYYVDGDSVTLDGNQVTYWSKVESKYFEVLAIYGKTIDCKERKIRNSDVHLYDKDGTILKSDLHGDQGEWNEIKPGSLNDIMRIILCDQDQPKKNAHENIQIWENIAQGLRDDQ